MRAEEWEKFIKSCDDDCPGHGPEILVDLYAAEKRIKELEEELLRLKVIDARP